jgi:DNA-binding LacI/PurR family transcriptional regulator
VSKAVHIVIPFPGLSNLFCKQRNIFIALSAIQGRFERVKPHNLSENQQSFHGRFDKCIDKFRNTIIVLLKPRQEFSMSLVREVARKLELSPATVSKAIRGQSGEVSVETARRVLKFCQENGYLTSSEAARILTKMQTQNTRKQIFVVTCYGGAEVYDAAFAGICEQLQDNRLYSSFFVINDSKSMQYFPYDQAGIVIVLGKIDAQDIDSLCQKHIPIVMVDNKLKNLDSGAVNSDNFEGTFDSVEHLIKLGHRRIAFLCLHREQKEHPYTFMQRQAGYCAALTNNAIQIEPELIITGYGEKSFGLGYNLNDCVADLQKLAGRILELKPLPTAVVAANDLAAYVLRDVLTARALSVPGDVSIVGYDGLHCLPNRPNGFAPVSTRIVKWNELGKVAVDLALELLGGLERQPKYVQIPTIFEDAGTVAPPHNQE